MLVKNTICLSLIFLFIQINVKAQEKLAIKFGKVTPEDFDVKSSLIDSNTNAVVVADVGKSEFIANSSQLTFSLIYTEKKRIKIFNKNGFDAATISIPLYVDDKNQSEKLNGLSAYTYNLENGKVVETKVAKSSVFTENRDKHWIINKFTFPALKEGSIVEYSYEVKSNFFFNLQPWVFQGQYPVLWSQYEASIPEFFKYVMLTQGYQPLYINKVEQSQTSFSFVSNDNSTDAISQAMDNHTTTHNAFKIDGSLDRHTWAMKNVPALTEEPFTTTINNSIAKIEFQISEIAFPEQIPQNYMDSWEKAANELMVNTTFGVPIEKANNWLDKDLNDIVKNVSSPQEKTKRIFEYVRDNFTAKDETGIFVNNNLKDVFKNKSGSAAEINMLLIAMLRNQNIEANPVILSTRDHGLANNLYPLIYQYNYIVDKVNIGDNSIYLDATAPYLEYGMLPAKVYNGQAREITKNLAVPVYFRADSLKEANNTLVFITKVDGGGVEGSCAQNLGLYESLKFREHSTKSLVEDLNGSLQKEYPEEITVNNIEIDSLKLLDQPVGIKYDLKFKAFDGDDIVYLDPMLDKAIKKNPFNAAERFYPVEMPYTIDELYNFTMEIPAGYKVDELPKSVRFNFNGDEGMFEYIITANSSLIQMRCKLMLKKANFLNEDYKALREFYSFIVKKEAEQIVFKKIK